MPEESTTPNLVELTRRALEASNHGGVDSALTYFAPDAVWSVGPGLERFEGKAAIRRFWTEWRSTFDDYSVDMEEALDLGGGVTIAVMVQGGHPPGGQGRVQFRYASVTTWKDGLVERFTVYTDIDEARAAAELLAQERG